MRVDDINLMKNIDILLEKKLVLYGAGCYGKKAYNILGNIKGADIYCYCESDVDKWKQKNNSELYNGIPVKSVEKVRAEVNQEEIALIICMNSKWNQEIIGNLENIWPDLDKIYTWFGFQFSVELNIYNKCISDKYRETFLRIRDCKRCVEGINTEEYNAYKLLTENPILVYQGAKVGSTTICKTLDYYNISNIHIHFINEYDDSKYGYHDEIRDLFALWRETIAKENQIKIINIVREPIARSISQYFQLFRYEYTANNHLIADTIEGVKSYIKYDIDTGKDGYIFDWYNEEIKTIFDVDIYKYPFDKEKGYTIIKEKNVEILILTLEKMSDNADIIGGFVGISDLVLKNDNVGNQKEYFYVYRDVLDTIDIDEDILDFYYKANDSMSHFYNDEQKKKFYAKWKRV